MRRDLHVGAPEGRPRSRQRPVAGFVVRAPAACTHGHKQHGAGLTSTLWIRTRQLNKTSPNR
ncbi:uncharacterized protein BCN122_II0264 [Burkholderia cenocepacia]|nr:uncharacterized protein BCN122_II0264 [Burkholderia cenocepacia]